MKKKNWCYFQGKITTKDKIKISPYDIGLLRGFGVFDVMAAFNQKPFLLEAHFKRLLNSAKELEMKVPVSFAQYKKIIEKLIKKNGYKDSTVRTILTGGSSSDAFSYEGKPTFFILIERFKKYPAKFYQDGVSVVLHEFERNNPKAKITNYVEAIKNQKKKQKNKALEIVFVENGKVLEASTSNIFFVLGGKIVTSKNNILLGTTRNIIVSLAKKNGLAVEEREIKIGEIKKAQEAFLSATNKNIIPVVKIDGKKVGDGKVGEKTKQMMEILNDFIKDY